MSSSFIRLVAELVKADVPEDVVRAFAQHLLEKTQNTDFDAKIYSSFSLVALGLDLLEIACKVAPQFCRKKLDDLLYIFADVDPEDGPRAALELALARPDEVTKIVDVVLEVYRHGVEKARARLEKAEFEKIVFGKLKTFDEAFFIIKTPYDYKLRLAKYVIKRAVKLHEKWNGSSQIAVFWSGGASSTAVLALVKEILDPEDFVVVYNYTWLDPPQHLEYMKSVARRLGIKHFYITVPKITPLLLFMLFGFPRPGRSGYREPVCSLVLKKYAAIYAIHKLSIKTVFTGEMAVESEARLRAITKSGLIRQTNKYGGESLGKTIIKALPIGYWTREDVEKYLQERGLGKSPVYDMLGSSRQCWLLCTNFVDWKTVLKRAGERLGKPTLVETVEKLIRNWGWQTRNGVTLAELAERLRVARFRKARLSIEDKIRVLEELFVLKKVEL